MAARTSSQAGNWSDTATWGGAAAPGIGDTASYSHAITVDVDTTVGTSPNDTTTMVVSNATTARTLTVAAGKTLTVRGNMQHINASGITLSAGASLIFDNSASGGSPVYVITNAGFTVYTFNGSSGSRCTFGAIVGQSISISAAAWSSMTATFTDFVRISAATITGNVAGNVSVTDFTFNTCTQLAITAIATTTDCIFRRGSFIAGTHANDLNLNYANTAASGTREVSACVLPKLLVQGLSKSFSYFNNYLGFGISNTAGATVTKFRRNFLKLDGLLNGGNGALFPYSSDSCYYVVDNGTGNPHFLAPTALIAGNNVTQRCVFEAHTPDLVDVGDCIIVNLGATTGGRIIKCTNNIVLADTYPATTVTSGTLLTMFNADVNALSDWEHNTANINNSTIGGAFKRGMFSIGEGGTGFAGQVGVVKGNLGWGSVASSGFMAERVSGNVKDIITAAGCNFNWIYNGSAGDNQRGYEDRAASNTFWTAGDAVAAGVDSTQGTTNPAFFDSARNIGKWCADRGYGANDYATGLTALQANPARVADLIDYIYEGYKPTNAAMRNAAHDGACVGAANWYKASRTFGVLNAHRARLAQFGL